VFKEERVIEKERGREKREREREKNRREGAATFFERLF
jgi:hypothetical protein